MLPDTPPPYKLPEEHASREAYIDYTIDFMAYFAYWSQTAVFKMQPLVRSTRQRARAYDEAITRFNQDPIFSSREIPIQPTSTDRARRERYLSRCLTMSQFEISTVAEAMLVSVYCSAATQLLVPELALRFGNEGNVVARLLKGSDEKSMRMLGIYDAFEKSNREAREQETLSKWFDYIGQTLHYRNSEGHMVSLEILDGDDDPCGATFTVEEKVNGCTRKLEDVEEEQLDAWLHDPEAQAN
ncbi:unnamed protein product [Somion occarium]|uniref:Uncharacterized protein n=1 Tax=Somion occarium TaxID=3059160 RepID=A0ABP1DBX0_9APHY